MVVLALHLAFGLGPQSTDAPRARGDEPSANEADAGSAFLLLPMMVREER